ncbi:MAG: ABC transporter permease [Candidatus Sericytochromatia bacterium]|nr:ABC transporter permease [Candidatus Sericytochromatia bacterium]
MTATLDLMGAIGRLAIALVQWLGQLGFFAAEVLQWLLTRRPLLSEVVTQAVRVGIHTVGILMCVLFFIGANVALVGHAIFRQFGGQDLVGIYVGLSCVIGLAPLIVGAMLAAKPGTEIAATIASMRVKEQIDALEVMAVNPYWYLMVPRFLAYVLVTPALFAFAVVASVGGGYVAAVFQLGLNPGVFMSDVLRFLSMADLWKGLLRAEVFAVLICLLSCFYGYNSRPGPAGVSRAINLAVVVGSTTIIVVNYFLTELMYG